MALSPINRLATERATALLRLRVVLLLFNAAAVARLSVGFERSGTARGRWFRLALTGVAHEIAWTDHVGVDSAGTHVRAVRVAATRGRERPGEEQQDARSPSKNRGHAQSFHRLFETRAKVSNTRWIVRLGLPRLMNRRHISASVASDRVRSKRNPGPPEPGISGQAPKLGSVYWLSCESGSNATSLPPTAPTMVLRLPMTTPPFGAVIVTGSEPTPRHVS